jgi:hypothetical protein
MSWDVPLLLECACAINADEPDFVADMFVSHVASGAIATMIKWPHYDMLASGEPRHAVANRRDHTRHFMPNRAFNAHAAIHMTQINM